MDRLSPPPTAELVPPGSSGGSALRTTLYGLMVVVLAAGGWVRFNNQIAGVAPGLAAPAQQAAQASSVAGTAPLRDLLDLKTMPHADEQAAVAALGLPSGEATQLATALKQERLRLIQLPLFDAGAVTADGSDANRTVLVSTAGFSRLVRLGRQPVVVTLPINRVGTVSFQTAGRSPQAIEVGAITLNGPMRLPEIGRGDVLNVGVAAE